MAVQTTEEFKNGGATSYAITIEYLQASDIKVRIGGVLQTYTTGTPGSGEYSVSGTTVTLGAQAAAGSGNVHIYRETDVNTAAAVFAAGSSIRAADLNAIHDMGRFASVEHRNTIITDDIKDDAVTTAKIKDANVTTAKIADSNVTTAKIADSNVTTAKIAADAINGTKIADDSINSEHYVDGSIDTAHIADGQVTHVKLANDAVDGDNISDDSINSEHYVDGSIDTAHIGDLQVTTAKIADNSITDAKIAGGSLDNRYYTETELDAGQLDNRYYTETEADARFYNLASAEEIQSGETWTAADNKVATTAAIDARIIDLVDDVGGFVAIANETSFPTANPDVNNGAGTIVSVKAASTTLTPSGTTVTIANGAGSGNTVTITGVPSAIASGFGFLVETTTTLHTYTFHRLSPKATEVTTVAGISSNVTTVAGIASNVTTVATNNANVTTVAGSITNVNNVGGSIASVNSAASNLSSINNFGDTYQVASSNPSTDGGGNSLAEGDLYFNTTANELKVYNGGAWQGGVTASGNFASTTGNTFTGDNVYNDNAKLKLGTGSDLEIFHNGSNSIINDAGTGNLQVQTGGSTKLGLSSSGVDVTGNITVTGTVDGVDIAALNTTVGNITTDVVSDTTPQLGGNLDVQTSEITTSTTNGNIKVTPNGTGVVEVKGAGGADGTLQLNCSANSHGVKIKSPPHSAGQNYTLTLPSSITNDGLLTTDANGNLSWATNYVPTTGGSFTGTISAFGGIELGSNDTIKFDSDDTDTNHISFKGPTSLSSTVTYTLPEDGTAGQFLTTNGSGVLSFAAASSAEVYGFTGLANGTLQVTTTDKGADNISGADYAAFEDVLFAASGFTFSVNADGKLIATI